LPPPIAERLKDGHRVIADRLSEVTVLFADLKGFSGLSTRVPPDQLVSRLDRVFSAFDELAASTAWKTKTIGGAYGVSRCAGHAPIRDRGGVDGRDDRAAARGRHSNCGGRVARPWRQPIELVPIGARR
jgi:class 3 adenylate cyclase